MLDGEVAESVPASCLCSMNFMHVFVPRVQQRMLELAEAGEQQPSFVAWVEDDCRTLFSLCAFHKWPKHCMDWSALEHMNHDTLTHPKCRLRRFFDHFACFSGRHGKMECPSICSRMVLVNQRARSWWQRLGDALEAGRPLTWCPLRRPQRQPLGRVPRCPASRRLA